MPKYFSVKKYPGVQYYESEKRRFNGRVEKCFYIRYQDSLGKRIREKIGWESEGITAKYAFDIKNERLRSIRLGDEVVPIQKKKHSISFADFMENRYFPYAKSNKNPSSYKREKQLYLKWIKPIIGDKALKNIFSFDIEKIKKVMKDSGKAPRTIEYALAVTRYAFNIASNWEIYSKSNPVSKVKKPKNDNKRIRFLSPQEAEKLLNELKKHSRDVYEMAYLSLYTGMRFGEIANLKWQDIDLENGIINIKDPKNQICRVAYITESIKALLLKKQKKEQTANQNDLLFKNTNGNKITKISNTFFRVVNKLGFNDGVNDPRDKVVFHTLRHTFASWLAINGTPIYTIKELMGHKTLTMTERYSHLIPDVKRDAVEELSRNMEKQTKGSKLSKDTLAS